MVGGWKTPRFDRFNLESVYEGSYETHKNAVFYDVKHGGMVATMLKKIYLYRRNIILSTASKNKGEREDFVLHFSAFQIRVIPNAMFSQTRPHNVLFKTWSGCTLVF